MAFYTCPIHGGILKRIQKYGMFFFKCSECDFVKADKSGPKNYKRKVGSKCSSS